MNPFLFILIVSGVAFASCTASAPSHSSVSSASAQQATFEAVGRRVWQNECAGTVQGLVSWNVGEDFPSLGIGHFIWYPAGVQGPFAESFPDFVLFARGQGIPVPAVMLGAAPWRNRPAFLADRSGKADLIRQWLADHIDLQCQFLGFRSRASLRRMVQVSNEPKDLIARIGALLATAQGQYCLIDYVNFKGEGLKTTERYQGQGWGLMQVLEEMKGHPQGAASTAEFSRAAAAVLSRRVRNAPPSRGEQRWLAGWLNRCKSYR